MVQNPNFKFGAVNKSYFNRGNNLGSRPTSKSSSINGTPIQENSRVRKIFAQSKSKTQQFGNLLGDDA
jgi:hypothetical protein